MIVDLIVCSGVLSPTVCGCVALSYVWLKACQLCMWQLVVIVEQ